MPTLELYSVAGVWESSLQTENQHGNSASLCSLGWHTVFPTLTLFACASGLQNVEYLVGYPFPFLFLTHIVVISWFTEFQLLMKNTKKCLSMWTSWAQGSGKRNKNPAKILINFRTICFIVLSVLHKKCQVTSSLGMLKTFGVKNTESLTIINNLLLSSFWNILEMWKIQF